MANAIWVLVDIEKLPTPDEIAQSIHLSDFPLEIDSDWEWKELAGWLPMYWDGSESGCEIDYEPLEEKDRVAAAEAGFPGLNAVLVMTSRGWDSLRAACVFAGKVAHSSGGCVSEHESQFIGSDEVLAWASAAIEAADTGENLEAEMGPIASTSTATQFTGDLAALLARLKGQVAKLVLVNSSLLLVLENGSSLRGNAWRLHVLDKVMDVTRWRALKQKETEILLGSGPERKRMESADAMQADIVKAEELDKTDMEDAYTFLRSVDNLSVESAGLATPTSIEVSLTGDSVSLLEFKVDIYLATFSATMDSHTAQLDAPIPAP